MSSSNVAQGVSSSGPAMPLSSSNIAQGASSSGSAMPLSSSNIVQGASSSGPAIVLSSSIIIAQGKCIDCTTLLVLAYLRSSVTMNTAGIST